MADAFLEHIQKGNPLPSQQILEATEIIAEVKRKSGDTARMVELAVAWVLVNPTPIKLDPPPYKR
jgi:hypothetical protein